MIRTGIARLVSAAAFALVAAFAGAGCAASAKPSAKSPAVIAVGDIHGDYDAYFSILREAGLIDAKGKWSGGQTILVQLGDIPDRGPDTRKIIEHLMGLEKAAGRKGGRVAALIGNHEAMNATGDLRYVTPEEYAAFATPKSEKTRHEIPKGRMADASAAYRSGLVETGCKLISENKSFSKRRLTYIVRAKSGHGPQSLESALNEKIAADVRGELDRQVR